MPAIQWADLPPALRDHLMERVRQRQVSIEDLYALKQWVDTKPSAPEGPWYKDFGTFKLCGEGSLPKTFLLPGQAARGQPL